MGVARSSFYADPIGRPADAAILAEIRAITDEFEGYGYRRVGAELRHRGVIVNAKKVRRLMKENDLNPAGADVSCARPIAITTVRSFRSSPESLKFMARTSSGWRI